VEELLLVRPARRQKRHGEELLHVERRVVKDRLASEVLLDDGRASRMKIFNTSEAA
jgi:hypothetical protein